MKTLHLSIIVGGIAAATIFGVLFGTAIPAWASVELDAYIPISGDPVTPQFTFSKSVVIAYPTGGKLETLLDGQNKTVSFTADSDHDPQVGALMRDLNIHFATETQSITKITHLQLDYQTTVSGGTHHADLEYSVILIPTLTNYVVSKGQDDIATVLDASWIAFDEKGPVTIVTQKYGDIEINYLIDFVKSQLPEVYDNIKGTGAEAALQQNLIDSSQLLSLNPLDRWDRLFDPSYELATTTPMGMVGEKTAVTTFSSGLSSLGGELKTRHTEVDFSSDASYHLDISEGQDVGTINVQGHANPYDLQGRWTFSTALMVVPTSTGSIVPWFVQINGWLWVGVGTVAVIGSLIWYFGWYKNKI